MEDFVRHGTSARDQVRLLTSIHTERRTNITRTEYKNITSKDKNRRAVLDFSHQELENRTCKDIKNNDSLLDFLTELTAAAPAGSGLAVGSGEAGGGGRPPDLLPHLLLLLHLTATACSGWRRLLAPSSPRRERRVGTADREEERRRGR
uniref:Uncharacterized protein n=1 Tax=Oryza sativa subsp. japonica TaxID=39947 RepID=Q6ZJ96_ORYSJ|nr:hypothetical protein [Oryza sativa Japonica Group]BAD12845.1 hypothetical protein [Oryza sativa Japonica Group]